jgi:hypothetical protein
MPMCGYQETIILLFSKAGLDSPASYVRPKREAVGGQAHEAYALFFRN